MVRQYIGARYVIKIYDNSLDHSADWESGVEYEALTMVIYNNASYLSRKPVPASVGNPSANPSFWVNTGSYNGQISQLQDQITALENMAATPEMYGAVGDGTTDDSSAFQSAVDNSYLIILTQHYKISRITLSHDVYVLGIGGEITPVTVVNTNLFEGVFVADGYNLTIDGVRFSGEVYSGTEITTRDSLIWAKNCDSFIFKNCVIDGIGYAHANDDNAAFYDFFATWIRANDVKNVEIYGNTFFDGGGDELIYICPRTMTAADAPAVTISNNRFLSNPRGGSINAMGSSVKIEKNYFYQFIYPGSIFNLSGKMIECIGNTFEDVNAGSIFDAYEGAKFIADKFIVKDNRVTGTVTDFALNTGNIVDVEDNDVECHVFLANHLTVLTSAQAPAMLQNNQNRENGMVNVRGNKITIIGSGGGPVIRVAGINVGVTGDIAAASYKKQLRLNVENNAIRFTQYFVDSGKYLIYVIPLFRVVNVSDNTITNPNRDGQSGAAKFLCVNNCQQADPTIIPDAYYAHNNMFTDLDSALSNGGVIFKFDVGGTNREVVKVADVYHNHATDHNVTLGFTTALVPTIYTDIS